MSATLKPKPSREPHVATAISDTDDGWFYESLTDLTVVARKGHATTQVKISWAKIMKAAVRCGWKVSR